MRVIQEKIFKSFLDFKEKTAIEYKNRAISYKELDIHSNRIANALLEHYGKGAFVGVLIENRLEFITAMIGILKAGCVFIPLEPTFPTLRLKKIIDITDCHLVLCDEETIKQFADDETPATFMQFDAIAEQYPGERPRVEYAENDRVYIYNTSGTAGVPKAVVGRNISLLHFIAWEIRTFAVDSSFRCSQLTNVGFDVFLRDTLVPLCSGACLCIPEQREVILKSNRLIQWIDEQRISLIHCVPSVFALFNSNVLNERFFKELKYILLAGEKVQAAGPQNWFSIFKDRIQLVNLYGPTETTLAKVYYLITEQDKNRQTVPIGKPMPGAQVLIFNEKMQLCDEFERGELYIRTPYMSLGYYNNQEQTAERFVKNPLYDDPNDIIYRTGDLGRILPDGNIELLGRMDRQVKIRGIRIELEEIESVLVENPRIKEAVVVHKSVSEQTQFLYAYITLKDQAGESAEDITGDLLAEISKELPQYMVPAYMIVLNEIPRKINSKVDYDALQDPLGEPLKCIAPRDEREEKLLEIWREVLNIEEISIDDSFFELGGNSLNLMNLILNISEVFAVDINLEQIVLENTIERQAEFIKHALKEPAVTIPRATQRGYYRASSVQERLYFLQELDPASTVYNLPIVAEIKGPFDKNRMEEVLKKVAKRHESLRTSFEVRNGALVQIVHEDVRLAITEVAFAGDVQDVKGFVQQLVKPFALTKAPLVRVFLARRTAEHSLVVFDFHHSIFDGFSVNIFFNDLIGLYNNIELPELRIQYKDYAEYQHSEVMQEIQKKQERYWLEQFKGQLPTLRLPQDYREEAETQHEADAVQTPVDEQLLLSLKTFAQSHDTTLFTVMLAACSIFLARVSGQEDIILGIPASGRTYADVDKIVGMFVNTIALRSLPAPAKSVSLFLNEIKQSMLGALEHQAYQFAALVNQLHLSQANHKNPLFDIMFQMQSATQTNFALLESEIAILDINLTSDFKMTFSITEYDKKLIVKIIYSKELFDRETVQQFLDQYKDTFTDICSKSKACIGDVGVRELEEEVHEPLFDIPFHFE